MTQKTILITGATDGIGLETARMLVSMGHCVLLHGRNAAKLEATESSLKSLNESASVACYLADLSRLPDVDALSDDIARKHAKLDVLINNAGIFRTSTPITADGLDVRFMVNTIAPYRLAQRLLPLMDRTGRIVNLSSAAQSPVDTDALAGRVHLSDEFAAYAQSKLVITMWSYEMARVLKEDGPAVIAVNPGSLLGTKMVKEGFGMAGGDVRIGADVLTRAALADEFRSASGQYFDNDAGRFAPAHADASNREKCERVVRAIESTLETLSSSSVV